MKSAAIASHPPKELADQQPTVTQSLGFGQVKRVAPEVVHLSVRTPAGWIRFESTVSGAENLFEQLGAALGHGLNPGERLRLGELENLLACAKSDRARLLTMDRELAQARANLGKYGSAPALEADDVVAPGATPGARLLGEKTRPFFYEWKASGKFLRPFLEDRGQVDKYQHWMQRFRFRLREEYQAQVESLLLAHNRNGSLRVKA